MHPALSIIVFTTLSGFGYGLAAVLGFGILDPQFVATKIAHILALTLIAGGLTSSTLHLGNPQRAWRALSQWRTSWLSREGVMAIATFIPLCIAAYGAIFHDRYLPLPGIIGAIMSAITVYCTSMIYGSMKSVQAWHTRLTPAAYLLFSAAGGALLGTVFAVIGGSGVLFLMLLSVIFLAAAWSVKSRWRRRMETMQPLSTSESATGLGFIGQVRLFERPHTNDNYLTREMGFQIARKHAAKLVRISYLLGGIVPVILLVLTLFAGAAAYATAITLVTLAVIIHFVGVFVERWLFFAEARHVVMNYYGR